MTGEEVIELMQNILREDSRYTADAYAFVRAGLDYTVRQLDEPRHVGGRELLDGIRDFALKEFGPMALTVLAGWGISRTEDIGEIVFNLVENGLLGKTEEDSRADFSNGYDFREVFRRPFEPGAPPSNDS